MKKTILFWIFLIVIAEPSAEVINGELQVNGGNVIISKQVNDTTGTQLILRNTETNVNINNALAAIKFWNSDITTGASGYYTIIKTIFENYGSAGNLIFCNGVPNGGEAPERMRIDYNGRIGIGKTTPLYKLDIAGSLKCDSVANVDSLYSAKGILVNGHAVLRKATIGSAYAGSPYTLKVIAALNNSGKGLLIDCNTRTVADSAIPALEVINRTNTTSLAVTVGGKVGIGTLTPSSELDVNGIINAKSMALNKENFFNVAKFKAETFGQTYENGANKHLIKIKTNMPFTNGCQMPYIIIEGYDFYNGNTIGLSLVWYVYTNAFVLVKGSSWGSSMPKVTLAVESGKVVILLEKEADKMWFYSRFTVHAEQSMTQNPDWFKNWSFAAEPINGTKITAVNFDNSFGTGNFSGNVSIGKSAIPADLTVNGSINCTTPNATVTASAFKVGDWVIKEKNVPDYVFKEDYQLKPLNEVEKFTRENHHLPDVPSASQMKKEGVDLVEMNMTLLKKVEELTLYVIELNKEIDQLKSKR